MTTTALAADPLEAHRWTHRLLLVFSPAPDDARALELKRRLAARDCEVADRDLLVVRLPATGPAAAGEQRLDEEAVRRLRVDHGVAEDDFAVVLVGKDGGAKLRAATVPDLDAWFGRIDAMPMRMAERRARDTGCAS